MYCIGWPVFVCWKNYYTLYSKCPGSTFLAPVVLDYLFGVDIGAIRPTYTDVPELIIQLRIREVLIHV